MNTLRDAIRTVAAGCLLLASAFAQAQAPTISGLIPSNGSVAGSGGVTINGTNMSTVTSVKFDGIAATIIRQTATSVTVAPLPHAAGTVDVLVTNPSGSVTGTGAYSYDNNDQAARDFWINTNPSARWRYGKASSPGGAISNYTLTGAVSGNDHYYFSGSTPPTLWRNSDGATVTEGSHNTPSLGFGLLPGAGGEYSVVQWTAPATGYYQVVGSFYPLDSATTDVHIVKNGTIVLHGGSVGGTSFFSFVVQMNAGAILDFAVGNGGNGNANDATGLDALISPTNTPTNIVTHTGDTGANSLREAINATNNLCLLQLAAPPDGLKGLKSAVNVEFAIPGAGPHVIQPATELPQLNCGQSVLGYTQNAYAGLSSSLNTDGGGGNNANIQVVLDGTNCSGCNGLTMRYGTGETVSGLAIHSFPGHGIKVDLSSGTVRINGNYIGTDAGGTAKANGGWGIYVDSGFAYIGELAVGDRNLITANGLGGVFFAAPVTPPPLTGEGGLKTGSGGGGEVRWNQIGGNRDGSPGLGNNGPGVYFAQFGGKVFDNYIRYNLGKGVVVAAGGAVEIRSNSIHSNTGIGIDLGNDGDTLNDEIAPSYDSDGGANQLVNYPNIVSATRSGAVTTVVAEVKTQPIGLKIVVELYKNDSVAGSKSGKLLVDTQTVTVQSTPDPNGKATATFTIADPSADFFTATASHEVCGTDCYATSEFSPAASVVVLAPVVSLSPSPLDFGVRAVSSTTTLNVTLQNTGNTNLNITSIGVTGTGFTQGTPTCGAVLAASASCTIPVVFNPASAGAYSGSLTVTSDASGSPHTVSLSGTTPLTVSFTAAGAFGGVRVGTTATVTGNLTNNGPGSLNITSLATSGAPFGVGTCTSPLAQGATCSFPLTFSPSATTGYSGTLTLVSNASGSPHNINLTGFGTAPGVGLSPSPLAFGTVPVGTNSTANVTINNPGTAPLAISAITVSGSATFTVGSACVGTLAVGATCQIPVTFAPTNTTPQAGTLSVTSDASGSPHSVPLSGTGTAPGVSLTPSPVAFGNVPVGSSANNTLTLSNTGAAPLTISSIVTTGSFFSNTTDCGASLAAGASCQIVVTYAPTAAGSHTGQVDVNSNAPGSPTVAPLSGTGAVPVLTLSTTSLDFGSQTVGTASLAQPVTITNTGSAPLNLSAIAVSGDFNFTGCPTPLTLAAAANCTLSIKFLPTAVGTRNGSVSITSNASGSPHAIALTGNGTPVPVPGIALAPPSASFGAITVGQNSTQVMVLSNPGTAPLVISSITTSGAGFSQTNACPGSLAPSAACNISVKFAPGVVGPASGQLDIASNAVPNPFTAALSGSGLPATSPGLTLSANNVAFPAQFVGTTSAPKTVTLTSSGTAPLVISQVTVSGDFAFSGCGPSTLAPNATCTFSITFRPLTVGPLSGSIVVTSNAPGSPHTIALTGTGGSLAAPEVNMSPSAFDFGTLSTGRSATIAGRLSNTGAATLAISQIQATGSFFAQSNNCPASVPVGGFCDVTVTYAPGAVGAHSGQLAVHANTIPSPVVFALSGSGVTVPPPFLATSGPVSFGQQVIGTTTRRTLDLTNTGGETLVVSQLSFIGSGVFGIEGGCGTIAPKASCSLTLTFLPTAVSTFNARLDIVSNHAEGVVQVQVSGQGVAVPQPDLEFSSAALGFANQLVGTRSQGQVVRLTNVGGAPVTIGTVRSTDVNFIVTAPQCVTTLQPRAFCDVTVQFAPFRTGPIVGSLLVDSSPVQGDSVSLVGTGCRVPRPGQGVASACAP